MPRDGEKQIELLQDIRDLLESVVGDGRRSDAATQDAAAPPRSVASPPPGGGESAAMRAGRSFFRTEMQQGATRGLIAAGGELSETFRSLSSVVDQVNESFRATDQYRYLQREPQKRVHALVDEMARKGYVPSESEIAQLMQVSQEQGRRRFVGRRRAEVVTRRESFLGGVFGEATGIDVQAWQIWFDRLVMDLKTTLDTYGISRQQERLRGHIEDDPAMRAYIRSQNQAERQRDVHRNDKFTDEDY